MNWLKAIGYGITLFALLFVIGSLLMFGLKLTGPALEMAMFVALIIVLWLLAQQYRISSLNQGIKVGLIWLVVYTLLDYYVIIQIFNQGDISYYTHWSLYLWYALIVAIPALVGLVKKA